MDPLRTQWPQDTPQLRAANRAHRVAIIGAGMSGVLAAIKLTQAGYKHVRIFERASSLGGTWRDNTYPGLSCDVPSHLYRYAFEANPNWSRYFSPGSEILTYLRSVADKYQVTSLIEFDSEIARADYTGSIWRLSATNGERFDAEFVIACTGVLRDPAYPDIDGLASFDGPRFHTARWDHDVDLEGRRVGIIGSGSTAVQIVPAIIDKVAKINLFQRSAQWIIGQDNPPYDHTQREQFEKSPEAMQMLYEELSSHWSNTFARAVVGDQRIMAKIEQACEDNLQTVRDLELRRKLTPDYKVACKRLIMSNTFYGAIQKPNAEVICDPIQRIVADGIHTDKGDFYPLDVLVFATGFHAHRFMQPMEVSGKNGIALKTFWARGNQAYRSIGIPGFPNFFTLIGPNSPIGNFSLIQIAETQLHYIMQLMAEVDGGTTRAVAPGAQATQRFNQAIKAAMPNTVWASGCKSWYLDQNGDPAMWPWTYDRFLKEMAVPDMNDFDRYS